MLGYNQEEFNDDVVNAAQNGFLATNLSNLNLGTEMFLRRMVKQNSGPSRDISAGSIMISRTSTCWK